MKNSCEISYLLRHMSRYAREHRVHTPLVQCISRSFVKPVPYGTVLIMSPWNYPVLLALNPLADALAAGVCDGGHRRTKGKFLSAGLQI